MQDRRRAADGLFRVDGAVGFQIEYQLVQVGALLDPRGIHQVRHAQHGGEGRIQLQPADRARLLFGIAASVGG